MTILPEDDELTILTGGLKLGGWTGIRVSRGVERIGPLANEHTVGRRRVPMPGVVGKLTHPSRTSIFVSTRSA